MRGSLFLLAAFLVTPHKEHCVDTAARVSRRSASSLVGRGRAVVLTHNTTQR